MTSADGHGAPRGHTAAAAGLIAAVTVVLYWRALEAGFVGDDFMILHRVRMVESAAGLLRFFRGEFFEYYRPLGFVLHTVDWWIAGADPRQFHLTNLLLHAMASVLVVLIGRELSPKSLAGPTAALLFALHASNHEAVVWVSARFDLLATVLSLAAIWSLVRQHRGSDAIAPVLFFLAVLSKESAVALPIAVAGYWVFLRRASTAATLQRLVPWLTALALYSVLRQVAGGISAVGGSGRLPKLAAFAIVLGGIVWLGSGRSLRAMAWLRQQQARFFIALAAIIAAMAGVAAAGGRLGQFAAAKLAVAGFVLFNLASPALDLFERPFYLDPRTVSYWAGGTIALAALVLVLRLLWRRLVSDPRQWVLASLLIAALLPISALTEGTRYLYLPSAAVSLIAGVLIAEYRGRGRGIVLTATALVLAMSAVQISVKLRDWIWAGDMTREGAQLVEAARPPGCGEDHVVFLTAPVAVRGVYTHFYYETFELPRGCMPAVFQVLTRVMRLDTAVDVRWDGPSRIVITAPAYRNNFVASGDLRHFDRPIGGEVPTMTLQTPLGELRAESVGEGQRLTLSLAPEVQPARVRFFYFSDGRIRPFPAYPGTTARGP